MQVQEKDLCATLNLLDDALKYSVCYFTPSSLIACSVFLTHNQETYLLRFLASFIIKNILNLFHFW
jgi:hypothetical protein